MEVIVDVDQVEEGVADIAERAAIGHICVAWVEGGLGSSRKVGVLWVISNVRDREWKDDDTSQGIVHVKHLLMPYPLLRFKPS